MYMPSRLPLNNLNAFAVAAEHMSFQHAAKQLHVTPSAVSHQIRNLEQLLGYALFERLDKSVRLTPQGVQLFTEIRQPFRQIHEASLKALRGPEDNALVLSVAPVFATRWLLPRLKSFQLSHPTISVSILANTDLVNFNTDPIDASIRMGAGNWPGLKSIILFQQQLIAVCHPQMIEDNNKETFQIEDMNSITLVQNSSMPEQWAEWFKSQGTTLPTSLKRLEVQNSAQMLEAIQSNDCIGLIDLKFIQDYLASGHVSLASEFSYQGGVGFYLTYPEKTESLPSFQSFKYWLLESFA